MLCYILAPVSNFTSVIFDLDYASKYITIDVFPIMQISEFKSTFIPYSLIITKIKVQQHQNLRHKLWDYIRPTI